MYPQPTPSRILNLRVRQPVGINLVNSSTPYVYDARTQTYGQPAFAQQLLRRFVDVNEKLIKNLRAQGSYSFKDATIGTSSSLLDLINIGLESQESSPTVLSVLFTELSKQKE